MAVLRYFHQDPRQTSVQESSVIDKQGTVLTQKLTTINQSITNNTQVLEDKLNSVPGKSLSTNDFTDEYKNKLRGIEEGAEVNVQSDWGEDDNTADSYIKNKPVIDDIVTQNSENLITSGAVFTAIDELPEPMIFKGSLGTGGTIQTLPAPSADNVGFVYKVITAGAYYGITAKPGDSFISDGSDWILIPSGDEPEGTVMSVGLTVPTGLLVSGSPITTSGTLAITYALGYAIPTTAKLDEWDAKQNAISDLSTIRTNASNGNTAYNWGNHANAGYLAAISDLATIRSNASEGHTAYGWGNHANAGYVKSSGVTSVAMTVPTGLSISGSPITSTGTLALSFANGYSIPTTAKLSNWDTAYGWGNHASAGYALAANVFPNNSTWIPTSLSGAGMTRRWGFGYSSACMGWASNNSEMYVYTDGAFYQREGAYMCIDTNNYSSYALPLTGGTLSGNLSISHATNATMTWGTTNPQITFSESGSLPVSLVYTDYDNYRGPAGLKVIGNQGGEWFECAGEMYANGGNKVLHAGNSSVSLSGSTLTVKINGTEKSLTNTDTNTWRGILNNLTSDSTTDSLSAAQGKALANGSARDSTKLPLAGGTLTGDLNVRNSKIWIQSNSEAGSNSNRLTTSAGMPGNMQYNTSRRGTQIYSNGIAFADPYNGNSNNDSAWIRHLETTGNAGLLEIAVGDDANNEEIRFRRYNTSNNIASDVLVPNTTGTLALTSQIPTNLNQLTNGPGYITSSSLGSYLPKNGSDYATWLRVVNNSSNNNDDALVFILNKSNNDWALKVDCTGYNYGINVITSDNASHAIYTNGRISCYSLKFMNTANVASGWNIYTEGYGLRILDSLGSSDRGAPYNYYSTGLHVGGQYWFLLAFERGDNRLLYRGGNGEGVTRNWSRIHTYGDNEYACDGRMWIQCDTYDNPVIIGANEKEDTTSGPWVGIGKINPSYKLHVNGACGATSHPTTSDIRIKDIQSNVSINLEDIANAPLFLFKWKEGGDNLTHVGTSALYWKEKVPELVSEANDERKTLSLEYEVLGTASSIAIAKEVVSLKEEIKLLQALIAELKLLLNN